MKENTPHPPATARTLDAVEPRVRGEALTVYERHPGTAESAARYAAWFSALSPQVRPADFESAALRRNAALRVLFSEINAQRLLAMADARAAGVEALLEEFAEATWRRFGDAFRQKSSCPPSPAGSEKN